MSGRRRSLRTFVAASTAALAGGALAVMPAAPAGAATVELLNKAIPEVYSAAVPANVCFVTISADGGHGGDSGTADGGVAAHVDARVPVTPGSNLIALVGAAGGAGGTTGPFSGGTGGFGGGGEGAQGLEDAFVINGGGGGGGVSRVQAGTAALVVAGGGGGAAEAAGFGGAGGTGGVFPGDAGSGVASGFGGPDQPGGGGGKASGAGGNGVFSGGGGGSTVGTPGTGGGSGAGNGGTGTGTFGGGGGSGGGGAVGSNGTDGSGGGAGGLAGDGDVDAGDGGNGNVGFGGAGGGGANGGGGGGGGYGAGGGGGFAAGGGGGSSFVTPSWASQSSNASSLSGNGQVTITYDSVTDLCPSIPPGAPTNVKAGASASGTANVSFSPPASTGTGPITGYEAVCGPKSKLGTSSPLAVTGLANGVPTTCKVRAKNAAAGFGPFSAEVPFIPGVPWGPTSVTGGPGPVTGSIVVNWNAAQTNGAAIQTYTVTCVPWSPSFPTGSKTVLGSLRTAQLNGLAPGQQHNCSIFATNSRGSGNPRDATPIGNIKPKS